MAATPNTLFVQCRMALGLTQKELADIVGRTRRTIQRWEDHGAILLPSEIGALARALYPARPDLAATVAASGDTSLDALGIGAGARSGQPATSDPIAAIVHAAADAMGLTPDAVRPAVAAAFVRASEVGLDVQAVVRGLGR